MGRTLAVFVILASCAFLAGCCCPQDGQYTPTDAACRCGFQCGWPMEKGNLQQGEIQLTPALNKVVGCPGYSDGYSYTKLPFKCDTRYDR